MRLFCDDSDSIFFNFVSEKWVKISVGADNINDSAKKVLQILFEGYDFKGFWRHIDKDVDITAGAFFTSRHRTEYLQRLHPKF